LAAEALAHVAGEVFLPMIRQEQLVCGFERMVARPLFAGYLFARFAPAESFDKVRYARGVLRVVGGMGAPLPVPPEVVLAIQQRIQEDGYFKLERKAFHPGDRVTITDGPLAGWIGEVEREWDDGRRVMIFLQTIQQARVLVARRWLAAEWAA
jgi:transcriptional antiterminator RfaH